MERKLVFPLKNFVAERGSIEHKIIAIYCLIDEMLKRLNVNNDVRAKITNTKFPPIFLILLSSRSKKVYMYLRFF